MSTLRARPAYNLIAGKPLAYIAVIEIEAMLKRRRLFIHWALGSALLSRGQGLIASSEPRVWRLGLTPVFVDDQIGLLERWRRWLTEQLGEPLAFVQRGSYREILNLLLGGQIEGAWLCGYPYVRHRQHLDLVAVPLWQGRPLYQSYLIVGADRPELNRLEDLRGRVFVYSDPDSNSGFLYPQYLLQQSGEDPKGFFRRAFFAWGHRAVVEAVGLGLADGGAVDGYVWETLARIRPGLTGQTRVIARSPWFGFPPIVANRQTPISFVSALRQTLLDMASETQGVHLLSSLGLDGFTLAEPSLYEGIGEMMQRVHR